MQVCLILYRNLIAKIVEKYNKIDVIILNAGINAHFNFGDIRDLSIYDKLMKTNFYANVYLTKYALNYLRKS
jgi:short-subunit dehydrogenase involved in D-alanine esterification of teichoic acids